MTRNPTEHQQWLIICCFVFDGIWILVFAPDMKLCNIAWRLGRVRARASKSRVRLASRSSPVFGTRRSSSGSRWRSPMRCRCNAPTHVRQCTRVLHDAHAFMVDRTTSRSGPQSMASRSWLLGCCFVERCRMREMSLSISVSSIASGPVLHSRSRRLAQALHGRMWPERPWL